MKRTMLFVRLYEYVVVGILSLFILLGRATIVSAQPYRDCSGVCDLAWSPVEEDLLGAVNESGLWLYRLNDSNPVFFPHENATSLSFDPKGKYVAVTACPGVTFPTDICNGTLSLFNIEEQSWEQLAAYEYNIDNVKFSPDGRYVAFQKDEIGAWGIQLIDLRTDDTFSITDGTDRIFTNVVIDYTFDPQSAYIALSNGAYGTEGHAFWGISLWRLSDQTLQARTEGSILAADLTFTETEGSIMFVEYDTEVSIWNYHTGVIASLNKLNETVGDNLHRISFSSPPTYLLAALWHSGDRRMLFVWDIQSSEQIFFRDMPEGSFTDLITINSTGEYIAYSSTVDEQKIVGVWEQTTGVIKQFSATVTTVLAQPAQTPTPTYIPFEPLPAIFPGLDCNSIEAPFVGPAWNGITIGASTLTDLRSYIGQLSPDYSEHTYPNFNITVFSVPAAAKTENIPPVISACVNTDEKIIGIGILPVAPPLSLLELVHEYGAPDLVLWDDILTSRVVVWLTQGVAASVSVDRLAQFIPYGAVTRMVYFPYQSTQGYETRWPYTHRASSKAELVTLTPSVPNVINPFDFDTLLLMEPNFHWLAFPSELYCENNQGVSPGPTWGDIMIGQSHVQDLKQYMRTIGDFRVGLQYANRIALSRNGNHLADGSGIPFGVFACVDPDTQIITALQIPVNRSFDLQDLVAKYGAPDAVTWGDSNVSRAAFWFNEGIAASTYILEQYGIIPYGEVDVLIYFPYQSNKDFETRWPYNQTNSENPLGGDHMYVPEPSDERNPFDFDTMIATITAQPSQTPTPTFAPFAATPTAVPTE